jgi:hypothetical protein
VVAQRHDIGPGCLQVVEMPLGEAAPVAGILAVDDDEIEAVRSMRPAGVRTPHRGRPGRRHRPETVSASAGALAETAIARFGHHRIERHVVAVARHVVEFLVAKA